MTTSRKDQMNQRTWLGSGETHQTCICNGTGLMFVDAMGHDMPCVLCEAGSAENERRATKPQSAGETPAAPPDPWQDFVLAMNHLGENYNSANIAELWASFLRGRATERQHHAAQLAEKDAEILKSHAELGEAGKLIEAIDADLTATRAEIARLTETVEKFCAAMDETDPDDALFQLAFEHKRLMEACEAIKRGEDWSVRSFPSWNDRALFVALKDAKEAAEASLLALQQQMETLKAEVKRILTYVTLWLWDDDDPTTGPDLAIQVEEGLTAALASHLTGGPA